MGNLGGDAVQPITKVIETTLKLQNYFLGLDYFAVLPFLFKNGSVTILAERWQIWNFTVEVRIAAATSFSKWYFRPLERLSLWEKMDLGGHLGYSKGNSADPCHLGVLAVLLLFSLANLASQGQSCTCRASGGRPSEIHLDSVFHSSWGQIGWPGLPCGPPGSSRNHSRVISGPQHLA